MCRQPCSSQRTTRRRDLPFALHPALGDTLASKSNGIFLYIERVAEAPSSLEKIAESHFLQKQGIAITADWCCCHHMGESPFCQHLAYGMECKREPVLDRDSHLGSCFAASSAIVRMMTDAQRQRGGRATATPCRYDGLYSRSRERFTVRRSRPLLRSFRWQRRDRQPPVVRRTGSDCRCPSGPKQAGERTPRASSGQGCRSGLP